MKFCQSKRVHPARTLIGVCIALVSVQLSWAGIACPVMLYGGKIDPGTVSVSFMNRGKVPMSQLELYCTPLQGPKGEALRLSYRSRTVLSRNVLHNFVCLPG